jgi:5,10-methylenetetrahydrofolate reductase
VVPFLTAKHSLEYCVSYADRAYQSGLQALIVLGGDKKIGTPRSVEHAWQLRRIIKDRGLPIALGGWANPHADPERQADYLSDPQFSAEFYLTQVVSHHHRAQVARFLETAERRGVTLPAMFGVFYYRSATRKTLETLNAFLPVPVEELIREFAEGATPEEICARTIRELRRAGAQHFYISNLPVSRAPAVFQQILATV